MVWTKARLCPGETECLRGDGGGCYRGDRAGDRCPGSQRTDMITTALVGFKGSCSNLSLVPDTQGELPCRHSLQCCHGMNLFKYSAANRLIGVII